MKIRFKFQKRTGVLGSLLACACFLWLATARLGLPPEKIVEWFFISAGLLIGIVAAAAILGFAIYWFQHRDIKK